MNARAAPAEIGLERRTATEFPWQAMRLSSLLGAMADRDPDRRAFLDQPHRAAWSGRPRIAWSYRLAHEITGRIATFLAGLGLSAGAPVGICLPNGSEACLTILAVEQAGLTPVLLSASWSEGDLARSVEAAGVAAVITQTTLGDLRPAEAFCRIAARFFGLRFLLAFGPHVPDGVIDLDRVILDGRRGRLPAGETGPETGIVGFERRPGGPLRPVFRPTRSAVAAAVVFLIAARVGPGERLLSLLPPDDLAGLTTGLAAALVAGATLECVGLFDAAGFAETLEDERPTHLVAPGWCEPLLARSAAATRCAATILVHPAPVALTARPAGERCRSVVDVVALGEQALLIGARPPGAGRPVVLDEGAQSPSALQSVSRREDGGIEIGGLAAVVRDWSRGAPASAGSADPRDSGFRAEIVDGAVAAIG